MPTGHFLEHCWNRTDADILGCLAEAFQRGEVAVGILRAKEGDSLHPLQGPAARDEFAEDAAQCRFVEWALAGLEDVAENFLFAGRVEDAAARFAFDRADFRGDGRTLVEGVEDLPIEFVDLLAECLQVGGTGCRYWLFLRDDMVRSSPKERELLPSKLGSGSGFGKLFNDDVSPRRASGACEDAPLARRGETVSRHFGSLLSASFCRKLLQTRSFSLLCVLVFKLLNRHARMAL